jgi:DNA-binding SARP family transcriptional activator
VLGKSGAARPLIPRPGLTERVSRALERGSLVIVADAGFGKTVALEQALRGRHLVAWVACREADREPGRFLLSLLEAVRGALPGAADVLAERLAAGGGAVDPLPATRELAAELDSLLVEPLVVVLDDAERLHGSGAMALVGALLGARSRVRLAVATRRELPLRLARLRASGELTDLRSADLAFTADECGRLLAARLGREPAAAEVAATMEATGGWALGLALGAARGHDSQRAMFEYLAEEVLDAVEPELREQVLDSSLAPELSPPVIESLGLPADFVERAQAHALLLRDAYHPMFREFLLANLRRRRSDAQLRELHARVARGLAAAGRPGEAVDHWLEARKWEAAVAAMANASPELRRASPATLYAWLDRLPPAWRRAPACRLIEGQLAANEGRYEYAVPLLREVVAAGDPEAEWAARAALAAVLFSTGDFEEVTRLAAGWDGLAPDDAPAGALGAAFFRACACAVLGRQAEAREIADRLTATRAGAVLAPALRAGVDAGAALAAGRVERALEQLARDAAGQDLTEPTGFALGTVATLALFQTDAGLYDAALRSWARTTTAAGAFGVRWVARLAGFERALVLALQGRAAEAELALEQAGPPLGTGWRDHSREKARAAIAALRRDGNEAAAAAEDALRLAAPAPLAFRVTALVQLAAVMPAGRARDAVNETLAVVDRQLPGGRGAFLRARLLAARAWLDDSEADVAACFAEAGAAARHVLRCEWTRLEPVVWRALEHGRLDAPTVIRELEAALPGGAALLPLTHHPRPAVREAALGAAAGSGHPDAIRGLPAEALAQLQPPALRFRVLGGFAVTRGSWRADDAAWERRVAQRLVRFLLLRRPASVAEDELLDAFWPDRDAERARRSLRVAMSCARAVLDIPGAPSAIEISGRRYRLRLRQGDSVDADEFETAAQAALVERGAAQVRLLERAAALWAGEPLPEERYSDWALGRRERLLDLHAGVLAALADRCLARGDLVGAGLRARELVEADPLNEGGYRRLMVAYARAGRRAAALAEFHRCRRALVDELGVEPDAETVGLHGRILAGEPV